MQLFFVDRIIGTRHFHIQGFCVVCTNDEEVQLFWSTGYRGSDTDYITSLVQQRPTCSQSKSNCVTISVAVKGGGGGKRIQTSHDLKTNVNFRAGTSVGNRYLLCLYTIINCFKISNVQYVAGLLYTVLIAFEHH